jgi:hypothetical protein
MDAQTLWDTTMAFSIAKHLEECPEVTATIDTQ